MPLHPAVKALLDQAASQEAPPLSSLPVELARQGYVAARAFLSAKPEVSKVENRDDMGVGTQASHGLAFTLDSGS